MQCGERENLGGEDVRGVSEQSKKGHHGLSDNHQRLAIVNRGAAYSDRGRADEGGAPTLSWAHLQPMWQQ